MNAASLHPPSHGGAGADLAGAPIPSWALLDLHAYFSDRRNSTTAACLTRDNKEIQVTIFPAHPPRVSYFCVHCRGEEPSGFAREPKIIAADANVLLLRISIGSRNAMLCPSLHEYYVYKASGGADGAPPSLHLLPHPSLYFFYDEQAALLSRVAEFTVVALRDDVSAFHRGSSERNVWTTKAVFVPPERQQGSSGEEGFRFRHETSDVVTIGGEPGTVAFVDMWRGILLFDVLHGDPTLRYIRMPPQLISPCTGYSSPVHTRDSAVVNGHFKVVEFLDKIMTVTGSHSGYINDGWVAATWSKEVFSPHEGSWCPGHKLESRDIHVERNLLLFELLPKVPDDEGKPSDDVGETLYRPPDTQLARW
ncbi:hypothetical protein SEVIR_5G131100v4 [Setaria viridis]|uniref:DUF1618 domain-containing protein n=1 Tax=Setaria viridis TaxID=4556 RepID=A0A4U6US96_SETVI|nr:uncharacterized protein LOC117857664 [Setaria viridis]XP_034596351.1 uncharacterized protein LOC117857664 [Setaria viridis]XP_034596352.1 uncharacterized protein LOC117857664 [Setaria viridis]XP_034596353.1 uncharacterized protein LOC117857664 [Setaria viridis]TKW13896.1 hypothetical protein SEVIR_5G131100v2 [Setaria viridis]TKW13897.1 hypothetical protein SEVIR_5G131100v2 [Setaria viridis]